MTFLVAFAIALVLVGSHRFAFALGAWRATQIFRANYQAKLDTLALEAAGRMRDLAVLRRQAEELALAHERCVAAYHAATRETHERSH